MRWLGTLMLLSIALLSALPAPAIEQPKYEVLEESEGLEIRRYEPQIVARTLVEGSLKNAGNEGFKRLANYIFGGNESSQDIAMTAPVTQTPQLDAETDDKFWIVFHMPNEYGLEDLPAPDDPLVELIAEPTRTLAVVRYKGSWSEKRYRTHEAKHEALIDQHAEWKRSGEMIWARYDPPFKPWFARTNEVAVEVTRINSKEEETR